MGSILSRIRDDENDYEHLCERYGERPQGGPYGAHAQQLIERAAKERKEAAQAGPKAEAPEEPATRFDRIETTVPKEDSPPADALATLVRRDPSDIRAKGWMVAVHNDYYLSGVLHTFWLFTNREGRYVKGEGISDEVALDKVREEIAKP